MTMTEQERFEKWWNDSGMKAFDLDGYHCAAEAWVAALDRPSLADDPDDDVEFCKWREDHNIDLGDKWVAWGAWQGAIQRFALDRSSEVELLLDALQEHHLFAQLRPDGDAYRESETYRKTTAALAPFLASDHPSNSGDE
jgi:hypothetical protein